MLVAGCTSAHQRRLIKDSRRAGKAIARADADALEASVLPGQLARVDASALADENTAELWATALKKPVAARPEALVPVGDIGAVGAVWTDDGWRFTEDPTEFYGQRTPRQALRSFVRATRTGRWDVLIELAPLRYRVGLSTEDLQKAWTEGDYAKSLVESRDRLEDGLDGPIFVDAHEAVLPLGDDRAARLEFEGDRWVVVDF